ncbi:RDD family protein [Oenococcus oeni]|uniref:RDD family protein n=1 Tax=Oenococcus oeni TaxID=1247 RepID=UPI000277B229|nr:RDD family protein [Oenococcus oeni]AVI93552.1 hypothetical protein AX764_01140 [Oenococcus oeni]EJO02331.1 hypothetical protein AWRIB418_782 [Oenococcus oeni AWRIB418]OIM42177.1 RDD family protein [Oenococcus oeni]QGR00813.1 RDD family protein [Oenococcus oeni]TEU24093.1 RDD family protein [Oenococcus oeni]
MERRIQLAVIRILASMIDLIVAYLPFQILCFFIFKDQLLLAIFFGQLLFVSYNAVLVSMKNGRTIGKYFAKIRVVNDNSEKNSAKALREFCKLLYFVAFPFGLFFLLVSIFLLLTTGRALHDFLGQSRIVSDAEYKRIISANE